MRTKVIALSGVARSGKDTFCKYLVELLESKGYSARRYALADQLKTEMHQFFLDNFGVNILTCEGETKEIMRPLLVAYGYARRQLSKGMYFVHNLEKQIMNEDLDFAVITDIRYADFEFDEAHWAKQNGILVHIKRILRENPLEYVQAPNEDERRNDPKLQEMADYKIEWLTNQPESYLRTVVEGSSVSILELCKK